MKRVMPILIVTIVLFVQQEQARALAKPMVYTTPNRLVQAKDPMLEAGELVAALEKNPLDNWESVNRAAKQKDRLRELIKSHERVKARFLNDYRKYSRKITQAKTKLTESETAVLEEQNKKRLRLLAGLESKIRAQEAQVKELALIHFSREFRPYAKKVIMGEAKMTQVWRERYNRDVSPLLHSTDQSTKRLAETCRELFELASGAGQ